MGDNALVVFLFQVETQEKIMQWMPSLLVEFADIKFTMKAIPLDFGYCFCAAYFPRHCMVEKVEVTAQRKRYRDDNEIVELEKKGMFLDTIPDNMISLVYWQWNGTVDYRNMPLAKIYEPRLAINWFNIHSARDAKVFPKNGTVLVFHAVKESREDEDLKLGDPIKVIRVCEQLIDSDSFNFHLGSTDVEDFSSQLLKQYAKMSRLYAPVPIKYQYKRLGSLRPTRPDTIPEVFGDVFAARGPNYRILDIAGKCLFDEFEQEPPIVPGSKLMNDLVKGCQEIQSNRILERNRVFHEIVAGYMQLKNRREQFLCTLLVSNEVRSIIDELAEGCRKIQQKRREHENYINNPANKLIDDLINGYFIIKGKKGSAGSTPLKEEADENEEDVTKDVLHINSEVVPKNVQISTARKYSKSDSCVPQREVIEECKEMGLENSESDGDDSQEIVKKTKKSKFSKFKAKITGMGKAAAKNGVEKTKKTTEEAKTEKNERTAGKSAKSTLSKMKSKILGKNKKDAANDDRSSDNGSETQSNAPMNELQLDDESVQEDLTEEKMVERKLKQMLMRHNVTDEVEIRNILNFAGVLELGDLERFENSYFAARRRTQRQNERHPTSFNIVWLWLRDMLRRAWGRVRDAVIYWFERQRGHL